MKISIDDVMKIAKLAMLEENNAVETVEVLEEFTKMAHVLEEIEPKEAMDGEINAPLRADEGSLPFSREEMMKNAPLEKHGYLIVPRTVED